MSNLKISCLLALAVILITNPATVSIHYLPFPSDLIATGLLLLVFVSGSWVVDQVERLFSTKGDD